MRQLRIWACGAIALGLAGGASANTVLDPSFTSGFGSDYRLIPGPGSPGAFLQWDEGTYAITSNPYNEHGYWSSFTTPNGEDMMTVNAATTAGERVWYVTLGSSGTYDFNALVANNYPDSPADLVLELNGNVVGGSGFTPINPPGTWTEWSSSFAANSGDTLAIVDLNLAGGGNDFALAGVAVPDGGTTLGLLGASVSGLIWFRRKINHTVIR